MKWIEAKIEIVSLHDDLMIDLIAESFYDLGLTGVVIEDPGLAPEEGWSKEDVTRPQFPAVIGYLPSNVNGRDRLAILHKNEERLSQSHGIELQLTYREIDEEDWADSWKIFFKPVRVDRDLIIKPSWENFSGDSQTIVIDIDPGMAFGTGTHPTTILCLRLLRQYTVGGDSFLDVGTGSGILSIAAAKFGADEIVAVDTDDLALTIAASNFSRNGIDQGHWRLISSHLLDNVTGPFDLVAANIFTGVIIELLADLKRVLKPEGIFVCSGIIHRHKERIIQAMTKLQFDIQTVETLDDWVGIAAKNVIQD
jgi:ribosomal protein L11 methyltransferase